MSKATKVLWSLQKEADARPKRSIKKHRCPCCGSWDYCGMESFDWDCDKPEAWDADCPHGCYEARLAGTECLHEGKV